MGKIFSFIIAVAITVGAGVGGFYFGVKEAKKDVAQISDLGQIVDIDDEEGFLTESQSAMLNRGAPLRFGDEIYQLSKSGAETVYTYSDSNDYFIRKYITINVAERTYTRRVEINSEYIDKDTLSTALAEYMKSETVQKTLNAALAEYMKSTDIKSLLSNTLESYVKDSDGKDLVVQTQLAPGNQLLFKPHSMYAVQCYDPSNNLADFKILGGGKDGATGRFALVFTDVINNTSSLRTLILYQTGSVVLSNLAATSGSSYGLAPASNSNRLVYYKLGGTVL
mgnify:CR=1 FL=1